jgi:hypothetical protein
MKNARHISVTVDLTPARSQVDQLSVIWRYVKRTGEITAVSFFLTPIESQISENRMSKMFLEMAETLGLDIKDCGD